MKKNHAGPPSVLLFGIAVGMLCASAFVAWKWINQESSLSLEAKSSKHGVVATPQRGSDFDPIAPTESRTRPTKEALLPVAAPNEKESRMARRARLFEPGRLDGPDRFSPEPQPVTWDASCVGTPSTGRFKDVSERAQAKGVFVQDRFARDAGQGSLLGSLNQYLVDSSGQRRFQLTIALVGPDIDSYAIELYEFTDATLTVVASRNRLAPSAGLKPLSRTEAARQLEEVVVDFRARGFFVANRSAVVDQKGVVAELTGGRVNRYEEAEVHCLAEEEGEAKCGCANQRNTVE